MNHILVARTNTFLVNVKTLDKQILYLQIGWTLTFTNSLRSFVFLGHPKLDAASPSVAPLDPKVRTSHSPLTAYSWKDDSVPFDPSDYTQYPTTYSFHYPHLPYIKRSPDLSLCLTDNDHRIIDVDNIFHLDKAYISKLVEFSQQAFNSYASWKSVGIKWDVEAVPELSTNLSSLHFALQTEYSDISLARQAVHDILRYSYEIAACRTLYYHRTLRIVLGACHPVDGVDDNMVGTVLEHPLPSTPCVEHLLADGVPIFCVESEVWRRLDRTPNGRQQGSLEAETQSILRSLQDSSQIRTIRVRVPTQTQRPFSWRIAPTCSPSASEPPIEDIVFNIVKDDPVNYREIRCKLRQVFGKRIRNYVSDPQPSTVRSFSINCSQKRPYIASNILVTFTDSSVHNMRSKTDCPHSANCNGIIIASASIFV